MKKYSYAEAMNYVNARVPGLTDLENKSYTQDELDGMVNQLQSMFDDIRQQRKLNQSDNHKIP